MPDWPTCSAADCEKIAVAIWRGQPGCAFHVYFGTAPWDAPIGKGILDIPASAKATSPMRYPSSDAAR